MWVTQMFALKWPWVAGHRKGKEKWSQMIGGGTPNGSGVPFPSAEVNTKNEFLSNARGRRTIAILLRAKDKKTETRRTPKSFKPALKTVQSLLARERREILQWKPRQKNKISNFGTFFPYTQIFVYHSLSLNLKKDKSQEKTVIFMDYPIICVWHFIERICIYITVVKNLCIFILPCGLCYYFMLSFQLLFALHYLA